MWSKILTGPLSQVPTRVAQIEMAPLVIPAQITELKPAFDALAHYPFLQALAALIFLGAICIGGLGWIKGEKLARAELKTPLDAPRSTEGAVQLFFDGPLKAIFDVLHEIQTTLSLAKLEHKDVLLEALSIQKAALRETMEAMHLDMSNDVQVNKAEVFARLDAITAELRSQRDILVGIAARQGGRTTR